VRWLLLLLLVPLVARGDVLRICTPGDTQEGVLCSNATTAWAHLKDSIDWIAANPEMCDVVIFPGDLVVGYMWNHNEEADPIAPWFDCWCLAQPDPAPDGCDIYTNPVTGRTCSVTHVECNDAEAINCVGGTPGFYCEHERARSLLDTLAAAGVPFITVAGNHEPDQKGPRCSRSFSDYNAYFGVGRMSSGFAEVSVHEENYPCAVIDGGFAEQAAGSTHVLRKPDGSEWLFLALPWLPVDAALDSFTNYPGMTPATLAWVKGVMDAHPGMPTIPIAHHMNSFVTGCEPEETEWENFWCQNIIGWGGWWTGSTVYSELMNDYPQIFMTIGGHIRELAMKVSESTPHPVLGAAVDYTVPVSDAPEWQSRANGGGGVVQMFRVDYQNGTVSSKAYSDTESEWIGVYGSTGSHWSVQMPLCDDDVRFGFPAEACPQPSVVPQINLGRIRNR